jgi:hypothetical protein
LGLRIIAPTARIIPRIIWGENRTQVRGMLFAKAPKTGCGGKLLWAPPPSPGASKSVCGGKPLWDSA